MLKSGALSKMLRRRARLTKVPVLQVPTGPHVKVLSKPLRACTADGEYPSHT